MTAFADTTSVRERSVFQAVATTKTIHLFRTHTLPASAFTENDRRWEEALASTTPEQWERLESMFREDEAEGTMPLDFTGR